MIYYMATVLYDETGDELELTCAPMLPACPVDRAMPPSEEVVAAAATKDGTAPDR